MSLLDHPTAQCLLADAQVSAANVRGCCQRLELFLERYLPCFYRLEHHDLARVVLQGKLSKLERKTAEPIASLAQRPRKIDNCQVGVFLAYVTATGYAPLDRQLYLPKAWADEAQRRQQTHVPQEVTFQESWRIGLSLLDRSAPGLPFGWVAGDDAFGRVMALRAALRKRHWRTPATRSRSSRWCWRMPAVMAWKKCCKRARGKWD